MQSFKSLVLAIPNKQAIMNMAVPHCNKHMVVEVPHIFVLVDKCIPHTDQVYIDRLDIHRWQRDQMDNSDCNCRCSRMDQRRHAESERDLPQRTVEVSHNISEHRDIHHQMHYILDSFQCHRPSLANSLDNYLAWYLDQVLPMDLECIEWLNRTYPRWHKVDIFVQHRSPLEDMSAKGMDLRRICRSCMAMDPLSNRIYTSSCTVSSSEDTEQNISFHLSRDSTYSSTDTWCRFLRRNNSSHWMHTVDEDIDPVV